MADIKNYTLNFGCGHTLRVLNFAGAKLACTEVQRSPRAIRIGAYG